MKNWFLQDLLDGEDKHCYGERPKNLVLKIGKHSQWICSVFGIENHVTLKVRSYW